MEKLSQKQFEILEYMKKAVREKGYPPSVREICDAVGLKSVSYTHLDVYKRQVPVSSSHNIGDCPYGRKPYSKARRNKPFSLRRPFS